MIVDFDTNLSEARFLFRKTDISKVETAHGKRWSICQVGLVRVENGFNIEQFSILLKSSKFTSYFTYRSFGENLVSVCRKYRIPLNHHNALSDALTYAELYKLYLNKL